MVINLATKILGADNVQVYLRSNEMTTGNLEILLENLRKAVIEEASVAAIDAALFGLSSYHNPQSIEVVLGLLDDTFDADEVCSPSSTPQRHSMTRPMSSTC